MKTDILERTENYLLELEKHLGLKGRKSRDILDEARSDLLSHVTRFRDEGKPEDEAVDLALEEMGDPATAARDIIATIPPQSPTWLKVTRIVLALPVIWFAYTLNRYILSNDFAGGLYSILAMLYISSLMLIPILFLWPTLIWRRNWMFGAVPAGLGLFLVLFLASAGTSSTQVIHDVNSGASLPAKPTAREQFPEQVGHSISKTSIKLSRPPIPLTSNLAFALLPVLAIYLLLFLQQRRQRLTVIAIVLAVIASLKTAFVIEESAFRDELHQRLDERERLLSLPDTNPEDAEFRMSWRRPLASGYSIEYSTKRSRLWIND